MRIRVSAFGCLNPWTEGQYGGAHCCAQNASNTLALLTSRLWRSSHVNGRAVEEVGIMISACFARGESNVHVVEVVLRSQSVYIQREKGIWNTHVVSGMLRNAVEDEPRTELLVAELGAALDNKDDELRRLLLLVDELRRALPMVELEEWGGFCIIYMLATWESTPIS